MELHDLALFHVASTSTRRVVEIVCLHMLCASAAQARFNRFWSLFGSIWGHMLGSILRSVLGVDDENAADLLLTWNGKRACIFYVRSCLFPFFSASSRFFSLLRAERAGGANRAGQLAGS